MTPQREFVDSNVLVYAHDRGAVAKAERAQELIDRIWAAGTGALSIQVLQEFFVIVTGKLAQTVDPEPAADAVADFGRWSVHSPTAGDVLGAIEIHRRTGISFWDALIVRSAQVLGCGTLWTEDLSPGQMYDGVRVANPFEV